MKIGDIALIRALLKKIHSCVGAAEDDKQYIRAHSYELTPGETLLIIGDVSDEMIELIRNKECKRVIIWRNGNDRSFD